MDWEYLGYFSMGCYLLAPIFKTPRQSIVSVQFGEIANFFLYAVNMQIGGAVTIFLNIIRGSVALWGSDKALKNILYINLILLWGVCLCLLKYPYDILLAFAGTSIALAQYNRDSFWLYRLFVIGSQSIWVVHSLLTGMYTMAITCSAIICVTLVSIAYHKLPEVMAFVKSRHYCDAD